jgi:hypothetical protein
MRTSQRGAGSHRFEASNQLPRSPPSANRQRRRSGELQKPDSSSPPVTDRQQPPPVPRQPAESGDTWIRGSPASPSLEVIAVATAANRPGGAEPAGWRDGERDPAWADGTDAEQGMSTAYEMAERKRSSAAARRRSAAARRKEQLVGSRARAAEARQRSHAAAMPSKNASGTWSGGSTPDSQLLPGDVQALLLRASSPHALAVAQATVS